MEGLTEGRIVHFVLPCGRSEGQIRPAIVTRVWRDADGKSQENGVCQLTVFVDQVNDNLDQTFAASSAVYDGSDSPAKGTWHWIPRA